VADLCLLLQQGAFTKFREAPHFCVIEQGATVEEASADLDPFSELTVVNGRSAGNSNARPRPDSYVFAGDDGIDQNSTSLNGFEGHVRAYVDTFRPPDLDTSLAKSGYSLAIARFIKNRNLERSSHDRRPFYRNRWSPQRCSENRDRISVARKSSKYVVR
jgi:hypothetical protein